MHNIPVGIEAKAHRVETESLGAIRVPADRCWRALTLEAAVRSGAVSEADPRSPVGTGLAGS
jgi:hypothetical protein